MAPYPTASEIRTIFSALSYSHPDGNDFFIHVLDNVDWTIMGHSPMSRELTFLSPLFPPPSPSSSSLLSLSLSVYAYLTPFISIIQLPKILPTNDARPYMRTCM